MYLFTPTNGNAASIYGCETFNTLEEAVDHQIEHWRVLWEKDVARVANFKAKNPDSEWAQKKRPTKTIRTIINRCSIIRVEPGEHPERVENTEVWEVVQQRPQWEFIKSDYGLK